MDRDPLALPPVPPPAPDTHRVRDLALAAVFVLAIVLPLAGLVRNVDRATLRHENRGAAPWPSLTQPLAWRDRVAAFERAFADRFGGRDALVRLHHAANVALFRRSPVPNVLLGGDGWLYFGGEDGRAVDRFFRGIEPVPDAAVEATALELARRADFLAAHGIGYVVVVVPEKASVYPEHLPSWMARAPRTPLDRLAEAVARDGRVRFVDLRAPLAGAKPAGRLYFKSDAHWNLAGAIVAYEAIMRAVDDALPADRRVAIVPFAPPPYVPGVDRYSGDLAQMLAMPSRFREDDVAPFGKLLDGAGARCARRVEGDALDAARVVDACDRPGLPSLLMLRDSMAIALIPLLSENFARSVYLSTRRLDPAIVLAERPDVVIDEMVERTILVPPLAAMP